MAPDHIDFWLTMGSTYSYLRVMRLPDAARELGIFGSPTFTVGRFWGDDRLEDAISWHRHGSVQSQPA